MDDKIKLYQLPSCPYCARVREALDARGVEYETIDVPKEKGKREEVFAISTQCLVPVLKCGNEVVTDTARIIEYINTRF